MKNYMRLKNSSAKILVIGDVMLDQYYCGYVNRISPESPVPVFKYKNCYYRLGGAANVAANLAVITEKVSLMSVIGNDDYGNKLISILNNTNIDYKFILSDKNRRTTIKTRLMAQNNQQMIRIDREDDHEIGIDLQDRFLEKLKLSINEFDIVLVSDYLKGLISERFMQRVIQICNMNKKKVIIDIKGEDANKYKGAYLLKPNNKELSDITKSKISNEIELIEAAKKLKSQTDTKAILVTLGEKGMILIDENDKVRHILTVAKEVFDVTGAGDTVLAYLGCAIANGLSVYDSAEIANVAAGIKVGKVGTSVVKYHEIEQYYSEHLTKHKKIITAEEYLKIKDNYLDKTVVFTNGCFDILHIGHIKYLKKAASLGDVLIVGVNSDNSVKKLKGEKRPIICEKDRIEMLAALDFIDHVIMFNEDTPYKLIELIKPDVLVKGSDYKVEEVVGKDIVEKNGGNVVLIPLVKGFSTTNIIERISSTYSMGEK